MTAHRLVVCVFLAVIVGLGVGYLMGDYWHCIEDVTEPGTPPGEDPDHWEEVEAPDGIEDGEAVFGWDGEGSVGSEFADGIRGSAYPFPSGDPTDTLKTDEGTWPNFPESVTFGSYNIGGDVPLYSVYCVYDVDSNVPQALKVYGAYSSSGGDRPDIIGAIYTSDGDFVAETEQVTIDVRDLQWWTLDFTGSPPALSDTEDYVLVVWSNETSDLFLFFEVYYDLLADYTPPDGNEWDPDEEYEYCQTVSITTTVEEQYCP
jgi:hypothetical protein